MRYRREVDGLRALAIVPVVLFHAGFQSFSGGFVGVDVFFVISGYLITLKILEDIDDGRFSIVDFYERRARRILPALFCMMLVCIPIAWVSMIPSDFQAFATNGVAVSLFVSNFAFWQQDGYFAPNSEQNPLLHTWSLAVEEQFYLFFPLFVAALFVFGRRWVIAGVAAVAVCSLLLAQLGGNLSFTPPFIDAPFEWFNQPDFASFYLPLGRAWELMLGALAAFYLQRRAPVPGRSSDILALAGLGLILYSVFAFDPGTLFPSVYTLVPTVGALLLILFAHKGTHVARWLSHPSLVGIGLISYSLYLWHQPVFAFARLRTIGELTPAVLAGLILLIAVLSFLSWRYVEAPFRRRRLVSRRQIFQYSALAMVAFLAFGMVGYATRGFDHRFDSNALAHKELKTFEDSQCRSFRADDVGGYCALGADVAPSFAMVGDSHAAALFDSVGREVRQHGLAFLAFGADWCAPLYGFELTRTHCREKVRAGLDALLADERIQFVVLAAEWSLYSTGHRWGLDPQLASDDVGSAAELEDNVVVFARALHATVDLLRSHGKAVVLIDPTPELDFDLSHTLERQQFLESDDPIRAPSLADYRRRNAAVLSLFAGLENRVERIRTQAIFCADGTDRCVIFDREGRPLYSDSNHLNELGALRLATVLTDRIAGRFTASRSRVTTAGLDGA